MRNPNWKKYRRMVIMRSAFRVLSVTGTLLCVLGFLYLIGVAGHSDIESTVWYKGEILGMIDYVKHILGSLLVMGVGYLSYMFGDYSENLIGEWIDNFEIKWNINR